jgi:hypothetical protein
MNGRGPSLGTASGSQRRPPAIRTTTLPTTGWWVRRGRSIELDLGTVPGSGWEGEEEQFLGRLWERLRARRGAPVPAGTGGPSGQPAALPSSPYRTWPPGIPRPAPPQPAPPASPQRIAALRRLVAQLEREESEARARWTLMRSAGPLSEQQAREEYFVVANRLAVARRQLQAALAP